MRKHSSGSPDPAADGDGDFCVVRDCWFGLIPLGIPQRGNANVWFFWHSLGCSGGSGGWNGSYLAFYLCFCVRLCEGSLGRMTSPLHPARPHSPLLPASALRCSPPKRGLAACKQRPAPLHPLPVNREGHAVRTYPQTGLYELCFTSRKFLPHTHPRARPPARLPEGSGQRDRGSSGWAGPAACSKHRACPEGKRKHQN